ncbi:trichohyalin-like [Gadus macrocephalus]|uniref:trichohyalin-like n=1 Tax=Gadus macrocephalus TaxID=80720 RepID=UPI0028CBC12B|nr:trichohyalin-like [Gadus macrocephalus]
MAKHQYNVGTFLQGISDKLLAGVRSAEAIVEASIAQQLISSEEDLISINEAHTPQDQLRALFHAMERGTSEAKDAFYQILALKEPELVGISEQRQVNSKMTQTEQSNSLENPEQLEEKVVDFDPQSKTYYLRKQKQETLQAIKEIEILFEYTKSEKAEIVQMKARNEEQQSSIVHLKAEKQQQNLLIMTLEFKLGGAIQKLQKTKEDIRKEKELIEKVWADVKTERELIDCRRNEFMNEREIFKALIMHDKPIRHTEPTKTNKQLQDAFIKIQADIQCHIQENKRRVGEAKQVEGQMQKYIAEIKHNFRMAKYEIAFLRKQMKRMRLQISTNIRETEKRKNKMDHSHTARLPDDNEPYEKMKNELNRVKAAVERLWLELEGQEVSAETRTPGPAEHQLTAVMRPRSQHITDDVERQTVAPRDRMTAAIHEMNEDRVKTEIMAQRDDIERDRQFVKTEMDEVKKMKENIQRQQLELDEKLEKTRRQIQEREVLNTEIDTKKSNLEKSMRRTMMKQQDADKRRETVPQVEEDMEEKERSKKDDASKFATDTENAGAGEGIRVNAKIQRLVHKVQAIRDVLKTVTQTPKQGRTDMQQDEGQTKWTNYRAQKQRRELDQRLEKIAQERDALEVMKMKMQLEKEEQKTKESGSNMGVIDEMKGDMQSTSAGIDHTPMEATKKSILPDQPTAREKATQTFLDVSQRSEEEQTFGKYSTIEKESLGIQPSRVVTQDKQDMDSPEHSSKAGFQDKTEQKRTVRDRTETESYVSKLGEEEEIVKGAMDNLKQNHKEMERLIEDISNLYRQGADDGSDNRDVGNHGDRSIGQIKQTVQYRVRLQVNRQSYEEENVEYEMPVASLTTEHQTKPANLIERESEGPPASGNARIQTLIREINRIQESLEQISLKETEESCIDMAPTEVRGNAEGSVLQLLQQIRDVLNKVKDAMDQSEMYLSKERTDMKWIQMMIRKQQRELDQRREKTLRERDELDILKMKLHQKKVQVDQQIENISKVKHKIERMVSHFKTKLEEYQVKPTQLKGLNCKIEAEKQSLESVIDMICQKTVELQKVNREISQQRVDMDSNIDRDEAYLAQVKLHRQEREVVSDRQQFQERDMEKEEQDILELVSKEETNEKTEFSANLDQGQREMKEMAELQGQLKQKMETESALDEQKEDLQILRACLRTERQEMEMLKHQVESERESLIKERQKLYTEINKARDGIAKQTHELDDKMRHIKRETREIELLKAELVTKRKENDRSSKREIRKREEVGMRLVEIQREKESLQTNTQKRRRELDDRMERIRRERDQLEVLKIKLERLKKELAEEKEKNENEKKNNESYGILVQKHTENLNGKGETGRLDKIQLQQIKQKGPEMPQSPADESVKRIKNEDPIQHNDNDDHQENATTAENISTKEHVSNQDKLRKMWKETRMERREIDHMKSRGTKMRKNLEQKLQTLRNIVKRPHLQREDKEPSQTTSIDSQEEDRIHQQSSNRKMLADKYRELEQLRAQLLGELEKLKGSRFRRWTNDRAMQTGPDPHREVQPQGGTVNEQEPQAGRGSTGLLSRLQRYCCHSCCCCPECCGHSSKDEASQD